MALPYRYGETKPIPFKIVDSDNNGVSGITFAAGEVKLSKDGATFINIGTECTEVGEGVYIWTPSLASRTQCEYGVLSMKDISSPQAWKENCVIFVTGGSVSAFYDGN